MNSLGIVLGNKQELDEFDTTVMSVGKYGAEAERRLA